MKNRGSESHSIKVIVKEVSFCENFFECATNIIHYTNLDVGLDFVKQSIDYGRWMTPPLTTLMDITE
jgi:hypothetical protein